MDYSSSLVKDVGIRLRQRRRELGYSQEYAAEKANLHPTYIGQVERGEKNITIESLERICKALDYPMEHVFEKIITVDDSQSIANQCYSLILEQSPSDQEKLFRMLKNMIAYKKSKD